MGTILQCKTHDFRSKRNAGVFLQSTLVTGDMLGRHLVSVVARKKCRQPTLNYTDYDKLINSGETAKTTTE